MSNYAAIDFGITNTDIALREAGGELHTFTIPANELPVMVQLEAALDLLGPPATGLAWIAVTGGQYRQLPTSFRGIDLVSVKEVSAIGCGGLYLAGLGRGLQESGKEKPIEALVVSAGSGTAMVAACGCTARGCETRHITGSAVGGGTLQGLGRLLLGTADATTIDLLAQQGNANAADLTLVEAIGGTVGSLPADANAVNFGRLARHAVDLSPEDLAAAIVRLVGQVIAVIAINAARAEHLEQIIVLGHLVDLPSVCRVLHATAGYYQASITVPPRPGLGTVTRALLCAQ